MKISITITYNTIDGELSTYQNFAGVRGACEWIKLVAIDAMLKETKAKQKKIDENEKDKHPFDIDEEPQEKTASVVEPDAYVEKKSEEGIM